MMRKKDAGKWLLKAMCTAAVFVAGTGAFASAESGSLFAPGTYTGKAVGMHGEIVVEIALAEDRLESVSVVSSHETPMVADVALSRIPEEMVKYQTMDVDSVSGSTISSAAVKAAVKNAFKNAGADYKLLKQIEAQPAPTEKIEDSADVVIVGGGGAGLAAAVSAAEEGASVIVVEKMPRVGGNTLLCGCLMNAYDEVAHKEAGTLESDPIEDYIQWTYEGGNKDGDMDLITKMVEQSGATFRWLRDEMGVEFYEDDLGWGHMPVEQNGAGFIRPLYEAAQAAGVKFYLEAEVTEIVKEESGKVTGVHAQLENGTLDVSASKGVILATGGCAANFELVHKLDSRYDDITLTTNGVSSTGEGFFMAENAGADLVLLESIQAVPFAYPGTGQVDYGLDTTNSIFVNSDAKRFMDEESKRDVAVAAIREQNSIIYYSVGDAKDWPTLDTVNGFNYTIGQIIDDGRCVMADTLDELAEKIGVDAEALKATVEEYNAMVEAGEDTAFGRADMANRQKIDTAPFYAGARTIALHYSNGGVRINPEAQVLDEAGEIIPGFYACGEVTGGVMGTNRMGGNGVCDIMVFGRIAGKSAAGN